MDIRKIALYVFAIWLTGVACIGGPSVKNGAGEELAGEWYRRYEGVIAGQQVVVNLHHFDGRMEGSYYYMQKGEITNLEDAEETADGYNCNLNEAERVNHTDRFEEDNYKPDHWAINFRGNTVKGKLVSGDGKNVSGIDIAESYAAGSYRLGVMLHGDSVQEKIDRTNTQAISYYEFLTPSAQMGGADAAFLLAIELHLLGGDTLGAENLKEYIKKEDKKYFMKYRMLLKDLTIDERKGHDDDWEYNFVHSRTVLVLYNDGGILSLGINDYDHSGGSSAHGIYLSNYACVDIRYKKIWRLRDIMNIDATMLRPLLEAEVRKMFKAGTGDDLRKILTVNEVPLTENVFITGTGVTFCYNPMVISTEEDGEISVFLPYSKLNGMLKEDFKKRMRL